MISLTEEAEHAMAFYKTDEEFEELERLMMAAINGKPKNPPKPQIRPGMPSAEVIEEIIGICNNAYDCNELSSLMNICGTALQEGIDWIPSLKARMALGCAAVSQIGGALQLATECYKKHPEEIDAYFALAMLMKSLDSIFQARKWFDLFKKGCKTMTYGGTEFEKELEAEIRFFTRRETSLLKILTTPKFFEEARKEPKFDAFSKLEATGLGLQRIKENPTSENLRKEISQNVQFRFITYTLLKSDDCEYPFEQLSDDELAKSLAESAPLFAKWDEKLANYLAQYLHSESGWRNLGNLQATCKPLRDLFNRDSVWESALVAMGSITGQGANCTGGLPQSIVSMMRLTPKGIFKNWHFCMIVLFHISEASRDGSIFTGTDFKAKLLAVCEKYDFVPIGQFDALTSWAYRLIDLFALYEGTNVWSFAATSIFSLISADLSNTARCSILLDLVSMFALRARRDANLWSFLCSSSLFPTIHQDFPRACATMGMLRGSAWFAQYNLQALVPADPTRLLNVISDPNFEFDGIYHTFMSYLNPDLYECHEKGVVEVTFAPFTDIAGDSSLSGKGIDTFGSYTFSTEVKFSMNQNDVTWIQKYDNGLLLRFVGVLQPSGFGGYFGYPNATSDPENPTILGYWAMVLDKTPQSERKGALKAFSEQVKQEKEKQKGWKIQQPLSYKDHSPLAEAYIALSDLRSQHLIVSSAYSPTDSIYAIASQLANTIAPLQDVLVEPPPRAPWETDLKYTLRHEALKMVSTGIVQARLQVYFICKHKLSPALLILKNNEHPKFLETYAWWSYYLRLSPGESLEWFIAEMETILRHLEADGVSVDDEVQESDSDFSSAVTIHRNKGKSSGISTNTFIALSAIGVAAFSIGAFFVGRFLASKNHD